MRKTILAVLMLILLINTAIAYEPPIYIAKECKYYFSGDDKHFNPRPENFTINIGYTTDFENLDQACNIFKCIESEGDWNIKENNCTCKDKKIWNNERGCIKKPNFLTGFIVFIKNVLKVSN